MKDKISIRAPARGATSCGLASIKAHRISIRAPARGATVNVSIPLSPHLFQSALPRGERHPAAAPQCIFYMDEFQSALPRGERQLHDMDDKCRCFISIRAPARGATLHISRPVLPSQYFNPRSREGSDRGYLLSCRYWSISIRAPARGATGSSDTADHQHCISIRAPARGATQTYGEPIQFVSNFNPRSREGSDQHPRKSYSYVPDFNPRSREGSDTGAVLSGSVLCNFNPRSREGSDIRPCRPKIHF